MTTSYEFCVGYTKLGVGTVPASAPTITVVDSANNILVAALTATTAITNLPGAYRYSYSGANNLTCYAMFHTSDLTMDSYDLFTTAVINPVIHDIQNRLPAALTANGNMMSSLSEILTTALSETIPGYLAAAFKKFLDVVTPVFTAASVNQSADNDTKLTSIQADYARRTGDYSTLIVADLPVSPTVVDINTKLTTEHGTGSWAATSLGSGPIVHTYTVTNSSTGLPIEDVKVYVYSDLAYTVLEASGITNSLGIITFFLNAGAHYFVSIKSGYDFTNPDTEVVA